MTAPRRSAGRELPPAERAREEFLSADPDDTPGDSRVHSWVQVSWERSRDAQVDADRPRTEFVDDWEVDSTLTRASGDVLDTLAKEIENEPVCIILTDGKGTVLDRRGGDGSLLTALDKVHLAPGFVYAESAVGTNGIGTALEVGGPVLVNGGEHYSGALTGFSCAGALVTHPINGSLLGVVDLTTSADKTNALMLSFAKLAARRIRERILENADVLERALVDDYYASCRHSGGPVLAVGPDVLMMNALTHQRFDALDQAALIAQAREARETTKPSTLLVDLPSGTTARLSYQPSFAGPTLAGGVVLVKEHAARQYAVRGARDVSLKGVTGDSPAWRQVASAVLHACEDGTWLLLKGERGVGKAKLVRAAHDQARHDRRLFVHDALDPAADEAFLDTLGNELDEGSDVAVLNAGALAPEVLDEVAELLQPHDDPDGPWVALTMGPDDTEETGLLRMFTRTVGVPPLRHHPEDIPALARHLLDGLRATTLELSPAATSQLMRLPWQGNVDQLREVLAAVAKRRRSGTADVEDLPASCRSTTRRSLSRIESLERDAIVEALAQYGGDKAAAADAVGMSRATIYRKIRDFGIVT